MTMEQLRPLLDEPGALHSFFLIGEKLAQALVPGSVVDIVRMVRLTALSKPDGGMRGIVASDVIRRLVACTISQQLGPPWNAQPVHTNMRLSRGLVVSVWLTHFY